MTTRTGWGFDAHRLDGSPPLLLGGVVVSESVGVSATSDGDVAAHAITDAVLGVGVLGDMGTHFPSDDPQFHGSDSLGLLASACGLVVSAGWTLTHCDVTVVVESVRVAPFRESIRTGLAQAMGLGVDQVSLKATTTDGLGFLGRGEGIAAVAVVSASRTAVDGRAEA